MAIKKLFDILISSGGIIFFSPIFLIISIIIFIDSGLPIIYAQERIGKNWKPFNLYKFRTMYYKKEEVDYYCTANEDKRVTRMGKFLRKYNLDELPQFFNVLLGQMSIVGPRPEVLKFINYYQEEYKKILEVKPGLTSLASIKFINESSLLPNDKKEAEKRYIENILLSKIPYDMEYLKNQNFVYDLKLIFKTLYFIIIKIFK